MRKWNLDRKMKIFIAMAIIISAMSILVAATMSSFSSITQKSRSMAQAQVRTMCEKLEDTFENYREISVSMMMNKDIRNYLEQEAGAVDEEIKAGARDSIGGILTISPETNFLAIFNKGRDDYVYSGNLSSTQSCFPERFWEDFEESKEAGYGTMRSSFGNRYFNGRLYTLTIYQPVYDPYIIRRETGLLCFNVDENLLGEIMQENGTYELCLIGRDGEIVAGRNHETIGEAFPYLDFMGEDSGNFEKAGNLYIYQRVGSWNYYLVEVIPLGELYRDGIHTFLVLAVVILLMVFISLLISTRMISRTYEPMNRVVAAMDRVSGGDLDVRIEEEEVGEDFQKLASGFNTMMDQIVGLMEQVRQEQHQVEQIRLNALQSQIQPHFLYNILDCIHWQAAADGNKEVSDLVRALATYYRICLSRGRDVIPLSKELEHIRSYLFIQNARYDHIIDSQIEVPAELMNVMIPKMTLQPLIENSIYHGIKVREGKTGKVTITAWQEERQVVIQVMDSGFGMSQEEIDEINNSLSVYDENFGYGVRNVNKRIELMFGKEYGLKYLKNETGGVTVRIRLPREYTEGQGGLL